MHVYASLFYGSYKAELEFHHHNVCAVEKTLSSTAASEASCFPSSFRPIGEESGQVVMHCFADDLPRFECAYLVMW